MIYERLKRGHNDELTKKTYDQLEDFATDGLRTLCLAKKDLSQEEYEGNFLQPGAVIFYIQWYPMDTMDEF